MLNFVRELRNVTLIALVAFGGCQIYSPEYALCSSSNGSSAQNPWIFDFDKSVAYSDDVLHQIVPHDIEGYVGFSLPFPFSIPTSIDSEELALNWTLDRHAYVATPIPNSDEVLVFGQGYQSESSGASDTMLSAVTRYSKSSGLMSVRIKYIQGEEATIAEFISCGTSPIMVNGEL